MVGDTAPVLSVEDNAVVAVVSVEVLGVDRVDVEDEVVLVRPDAGSSG